MKKLIALTLLIPLFLGSCSIDWDDSKDKRITELEKQLQEIKNTQGTSNFEKQTKCAALTPEIEKRLVSVQAEYKDLGTFRLGGIFYSPVKDACLWIRLTETTSPDGAPMERKALYQYGEDLGTATPLVNCERMLNDTMGVNTCEKWDAEILRLKGEGVGNI